MHKKSLRPPEEPLRKGHIQPNTAKSGRRGSATNPNPAVAKANPPAAVHNEPNSRRDKDEPKGHGPQRTQFPGEQDEPIPHRTSLCRVVKALSLPSRDSLDSGPQPPTQRGPSSRFGHRKTRKQSKPNGPGKGEPNQGGARRNPIYPSWKQSQSREAKTNPTPPVHRGVGLGSPITVHESRFTNLQ